MVTNPIDKLVEQGLPSMNTRDPVSSFDANCMTGISILSYLYAGPTYHICSSQLGFPYVLTGPYSHTFSFAASQDSRLFTFAWLESL